MQFKISMQVQIFKDIDRDSKKITYKFNRDNLEDLVKKSKKTLKRVSGRWKNDHFINDLDFIERLQRNENFSIAYIKSFINEDVIFIGVYHEFNKLGTNSRFNSYGFEIHISELNHRRCSRFAYAVNLSLKRNWETYNGFFTKYNIEDLRRNDFENFLNNMLYDYLINRK